uniref:Prune exopolyphosphatase n=1 Tax=Haplochromis burtoni TaxID=8153 RepID=A0A3Q2WLS5_HAPBU
MEEFLTSCQRALSSDQVGPGFHVVLGNEACDIDSMVSALAYAYFLSKVSHSPIKHFALALQAYLLQSFLLACLLSFLFMYYCRVSAIVVDCVDMSPAAGKVTPKDSQYAAALENLFPALPPRGALFQELHRAKLDVSGLNTEEMLLKDMKAVSGSLNLSVSVLYISLQEFLQREDLEAELSGFCQKYGYDLLLLMTIFFTESKEPIRELAVFSHSTTCREQVSQYLEQAQSPALNLSPLSSPHSHISAYHQGNSLASRKKLLPIMKDFLTTWDGYGFPGDRKDELSQVPPTPMNSLVEGSPLDNGLPRITSQALEEKFSQMVNRTDL